MVSRAGFVAGALTCGLLGALSGIPASAQTQTSPPTTTTPAPLVPPKAYIVVDAASGSVVDASNDRTPLPPASLTKILTALAATAALPPDAAIPISEVAAAMPARKLNMKAGEVWDLEDTLHALMLSSANDAGAALAERISGRLDNFATALRLLASQLRLADSPVLQDPSGLDDADSVGGGNLISARDLGIAARALLAEPRLAPVVATPVYEFVDPGGVPHRLGNHNKLLKLYPGAIGMKTGFTKKSGRGLVAAATRDNRTMIVVIIGADDTYGWATRLLDAGFARGVAASDPRLPPLPSGLRITPDQADPADTVDAGPVSQPVANEPALDEITATAGSEPPGATVRIGALALVVVLALRARVRVRRWRKRRRRATARVRGGVVARPKNSLTPHHRPSDELAERFHAISRD
ncbi:MAG TPA: hypothetical protein VNB24_07035 [Acidimicrobiales bacterium]|nr:hypothetical protein [Acidimicrobiales bacterium]